MFKKCIVFALFFGFCVDVFGSGVERYKWQRCPIIKPAQQPIFTSSSSSLQEPEPQRTRESRKNKVLALVKETTDSLVKIDQELVDKIKYSCAKVDGWRFDNDFEGKGKGYVGFCQNCTLPSCKQGVQLQKDAVRLAAQNCTSPSCKQRVQLQKDAARLAAKRSKAMLAQEVGIRTDKQYFSKLEFVERPGLYTVRREHYLRPPYKIANAWRAKIRYDAIECPKERFDEMKCKYLFGLLTQQDRMAFEEYLHEVFRTGR